MTEKYGFQYQSNNLHLPQEMYVVSHYCSLSSMAFILTQSKPNVVHNIFLLSIRSCGADARTHSWLEWLQGPKCFTNLLLSKFVGKKTVLLTPGSTVPSEKLTCTTLKQKITRSPTVTHTLCGRGKKDTEEYFIFLQNSINMQDIPSQSVYLPTG